MKHSFKWRASDNHGLCVSCQLETAVKAVGPKGGMKQVYRVGNAWVTTTPECGAKNGRPA